MAKGFNTRSVEGFVPGMENDSEFLGVSFRRAKSTENLKENLKDAAKFLSEKCKLYGVKPLGAVVAPGLGTRGLKRDLIKLMVQAARGDLEKVATKYNVKYPEHELTVEKIQAIMASSKSTAQVAKELLAD